MTSCTSLPTAIIFDMDGVLIDSEPAHKLAKERAFARFGITLPEALYEQYKGRPDETMMSEVVPSIPGLKLDVQEMLRLKHQEFEAVEHLALPIEGAREFVSWAKTRFRIALATSELAETGRRLCFRWDSPTASISWLTHPASRAPSPIRKSFRARCAG